MRNFAVGLSAAACLLGFAAHEAAAEQNVKVGWCARTISSAVAPFAIATKMGWFKKDGISLDLEPLPGSTDCVKNVATKEVMFSVPSVEPLAIIRPQGVKAKVFYTAYQGNIYGIAVPKASPVKTMKDLKGKSIGVISMASAGVIVARALAANAGLNPDSDVRIVVAGEGAQTAALLRTNQVDALSQFDTQYAMVENAGVDLRVLDTKEIDRFPSNGFVALEETLKDHRKEAVALAQGYAKGTVFAIANPEAAIRILWEIYPQTKPTGKDEATALKDDVKVLEARAVNWKLDKAGVSKWGENSEKNYADYLAFLEKWGVLKQKVAVGDVITNDLIADINRFDPNEVAQQAKSYKYK
jgi:NitT/TauT family transport system substrate-binding protein